MAVCFSREASCQGTRFGAYLIIDSFDLRSEHIHIFVGSLRPVQAMICASPPRGCGDIANNSRQGVEGGLWGAEHLKYHTSGVSRPRHALFVTLL